MKKNKDIKAYKGSIRFGIGYDIHRLVKGRKLILGGIKIPSEKGLLGHSDADVLLHAICDALLGAAALGDIGKHFPNTDKTYRNISSLILLKKVGDILDSNGYSVGNIDSTVILEHPKIGRYAGSMRRKIAAALGIPGSRISIKATTNEGLGALGKNEGCAAFAVAFVEDTGGR
jgi:2-C-methyl-D-erythritol 2,4-cyclodiphosphate synthase